MDFNAYQRESRMTAVYGAAPRIADDGLDLIYVLLKLAGESGECAEVMGKFLRDGTDYEELRERLRKELGDVLWYLAQACTELDISMNVVAHDNLNKLKGRKERGTLRGSGDDR